MSNYPPTTNCVSESFIPHHQLPPKIPRKFCGAPVPPNFKNNPAKKIVVPVPAKSQKQSSQKFCGANSCQISKRFLPDGDAICGMPKKAFGGLRNLTIHEDNDIGMTLYRVCRYIGRIHNISTLLSRVKDKKFSLYVAFLFSNCAQLSAIIAAESNHKPNNGE